MADIEFTNILNREQDGATCNLLRVGDIKILLDCGCSESITDSHMFDEKSAIRRVDLTAQDVHYIFISHATPQQLGALPFLVKMGRL